MGKMKELGLLDCEDRQSIEENFERISKGGGGDLLETVETEVPLVITWDGNTEGLESFSTFYKVSDKILKIDEVIDANIVFINGDEELVLNVTAEKIVDLSTQGVSAFMFMDVVFVASEDFSVEGMSGSAGIYFGGAPEVNEYIKSLTCPNATTTTTKQQLKPSLLPNHKHKWDDLEDAICWDRSVSEPLNITFDGDLTGKETVDLGDNQILVKVSDAILGIEQLVGATYETSDGNSSTFSNEDITDGATTPMNFPVYICNTPPGSIWCARESFVVGEEPFSAGVWFTVSIDGLSSTWWVKSLSNPNVTITTEELKKIDPKFYDQPCYEYKGNSIFSETLTTSVDGNSAKVNTGKSPVFQIGDNISVSINGVEKNSMAKSYDDDINHFAYIGNLYLIGIGEDNGENYCILYNTDYESPVMLFCTKEEGTYTVQLAKTTIVPLPPKFMPELTQVILKSTTEGSEKKFRVTVDDTGALTAVEV